MEFYVSLIYNQLIFTLSTFATTGLIWWWASQPTLFDKEHLNQLKSKGYKFFHLWKPDIGPDTLKYVLFLISTYSWNHKFI